MRVVMGFGFLIGAGAGLLVGYCWANLRSQHHADMGTLADAAVAGAAHDVLQIAYAQPEMPPIPVHNALVRLDVAVGVARKVRR